MLCHRPSVWLSESMVVQVFNVSTGTGTTIDSLAQLVREVSGADVEVIHEDVAEGESSRYYDRIRLPQELKELIQSFRKAESLLGWKPIVDLAAGIEEEYEWLSAHPERCRRIRFRVGGAAVRGGAPLHAARSVADARDRVRTPGTAGAGDRKSVV